MIIKKHDIQLTNPPQTVLVTGISGWIAQFCAVELIKNGFKVRGSLRTFSRKVEVEQAISSVVDITDMLEFCELDLLKDDGWDDAMLGCTYALHVASPFVMAAQKDENTLIKPAKEGTIRALSSAKKAGVKRVVLTSSVAAMLGHLKEGTCTPSTWTDLTDGSLSAYQKSKTVAEKAAWEFIENQTGSHNLELTVINPGAVLGPTLSNDIYGESLNICSELLSGKMPGIPNLNIVMVDVRDVAKHHVQAMTYKDANNKRYISALQDPTPFIEFARTLKDNGYEVPTRKVPSLLIKFLGIFDPKVRGMAPFLDRYVSCDNSDTVSTFNWVPIPLKDTFLDMAKSVKAVLDKQT